jgi:hypothetical protein
MTKATVLFFVLLLAACSDQQQPRPAVNEMIESPLQNTVISSGDHYPPRPVLESTGSINASGDNQHASTDATSDGAPVQIR